MERVIIIRYGEIFLKGKNRDYFESLLIHNIKDSLEGLTYTFTKSQGRYFIENYDLAIEDELVDKIIKVFGVYSISIGEKVPTNEEGNYAEIRKALVQLAVDTVESTFKKDPSFRVTVKRADKKLKMNSAEIAAYVAGDILRAIPNFRVDLDNHDFEFFVDIRENGKAFVYCGVIPGPGGLPVGCSDKGLVLISGGIDSPVATYMMAKRGMKLVAIHFASPPYTSEKAKEKVVELRNIVSKYATPIKIYVVNFTDIQVAIHEKCPAELMITIMRRFMMRIATEVAKREKCGAIITGESLGQVASQTVQSITCTNAVTTTPVFRPLIGMDKEEIMAIARKIGTFDTSILPYEDCCTIFLPKQPAIRPKLEYVEKVEKNIENAEELMQKALDEMEVL